MINERSFPDPERYDTIRTIDMHTGGEPLRIVVSGLPPLPGNSILEKQLYFRENLDHLRTRIIHEPRGHNDMYGAIVTGSVIDNCDFGVFFLHNEGYSSMCGHAVLALARYFYDNPYNQFNISASNIRLEVPAGIVNAHVHLSNGKYHESSFINVPSFVYRENVEVTLSDGREINVDIAFGGAFYAICELEQLGLLVTSPAKKFVALATEIKETLIKTIPIIHPVEPTLGFLYGIIFTGPSEQGENHSRNVCIFADSELDRSATGTGVSARAALHFLRGEMKLHTNYFIESIIGSILSVSITEETEFGGYKAIVPKVGGKAYYSGFHEFIFEKDDPLRNGFRLK